MTANPVFATLFATALERIFETQLGKAVRVEAAVATQAHAQGETPAAEAVVLPLEGKLPGVLSIAADDLTALLQAGFAKGGDNSVGPSTLEQILIAGQPAIEEAFAAWDLRVGTIRLHAGQEVEDTLTLAHLVLTAGDTGTATLRLFADSSFMNALEAQGLRDSIPGSAEKSLAAAPSSSVHLQRVIDVPLSVTLRFGQRQLTLREVLELNTGSLVELDQEVEEPVQLMLGNRVIARGEVVIVDGNYGMRVTEVVESSRQRLSSLV